MGIPIGYQCAHPFHDHPDHGQRWHCVMAAQVPGRIGDACVAGGAAYADDEVGGCGSTGDGDLHLRFQPCYQAGFCCVPVAGCNMKHATFHSDAIAHVLLGQCWN